ncbi:MAG: hypothetical protein ACO39Z_03900 [Paracoccaceae bacterium]|jgi:hypothetical protein
MPRILIIVFGLSLLSTAAQADVVRKACLVSTSKSANSRMCSCIQAAADATLNRSDQNLAASMIRDPEKSQDVKTSNRRSMEKFWERYENFGKLAEAYCS